MLATSLHAAGALCGSTLQVAQLSRSCMLAGASFSGGVTPSKMSGLLHAARPVSGASSSGSCSTSGRAEHEAGEQQPAPGRPSAGMERSWEGPRALCKSTGHLSLPGLAPGYNLLDHLWTAILGGRPDIGASRPWNNLAAAPTLLHRRGLVSMGGRGREAAYKSKAPLPVRLDLPAAVHEESEEEKDCFEAACELIIRWGGGEMSCEVCEYYTIDISCELIVGCNTSLLLKCDAWAEAGGVIRPGTRNEQSIFSHHAGRRWDQGMPANLVCLFPELTPCTPCTDSTPARPLPLPQASRQRPLCVHCWGLGPRPIPRPAPGRHRHLD